MNVSEAFKAMVRSIMRDVRYHKHYTATVQSQTGDTVHLIPDDPKIRSNGLTDVQIMHGLPGVSVKVLPGTKVTLWYANGDPTEPRASLWQGGMIELSFHDGVMPYARVGDGIAITSATSATGGPVTGVGVITAGDPQVKG
jgi:hypothetical protein